MSRAADDEEEPDVDAAGFGGCGFHARTSPRL
jgi:hypothetical protein